MDNAELNALIERIHDSLGPNPSKEETVAATTAAMLALPEEKRQSITVDQLRRLAVYRTVEFELSRSVEGNRESDSPGP